MEIELSEAEIVLIQRALANISTSTTDEFDIWLNLNKKLNLALFIWRNRTEVE